MSYPGNNSLAPEIRQRILLTFEQTLDLASRGELREATIGCDFILRLDPTFAPADRLKERLAQGDGPPLVDDLRLAEQPAPQPTSSGDVFELAQRPSAATDEAATDEAATDEAATDEEAAVEIEREGASEVEAGGEDHEIDEGPPPGLMSSPAAADHEAVFSDVQARELEEALDWSALSGPAAGESETAAEVATDDSPTPAAAAEAVEESVATPVTVDQTTENGGPAPPGEPVAALDSESEERIQELLAEGQAAFEKGGYQSAIDAWSRIFLVDIDHQEASRRIELARKLKAEVERQVEELYHEGVSQVEQGEFDAARESFAKVIEMQGSHLAAQEYLDKLEAGTIDAAPPADEPAAAPPPAGDTLSIPSDLDVPGVPGSDLDDLPGDALDVPDDLGDLPASPGTPAKRPARARPAPTAAKTRGIRRSFLYIGGGVLVLAVAATWFLYRNFDDTFPNAGQQPPPAARPQVDVVARAQQVFDEGNADLAIAQLKRLPPNHPRYAEAQALIAQWETPESETGDQPAASPQQIGERDRLVEAARIAFDERQFLRSHRLLTQAAAVTGLSDEGLQLQTAAALELQPLRSEIEVFKQGEWATALRSLWQMRQEDPGNPDVRQLMVDSYYNLGVRELQRRDPTAAAENLREALELAGEDRELERVLRFAETYTTRPVDLLYRIFVKYLPFR